MNTGDLPLEERKLLLGRLGQSILAATSEFLEEDDIEGIRMQIVIGAGDLTASFGAGYDLEDPAEQDQAVHDAITLAKAVASQAGYEFRESHVVGDHPSPLDLKPKGQG